MAGPVVHFYGDSFVEGFGDPAGLGWVGRVSDLAADAGLMIEPVNRGIQGAVAAQIAAELRLRLHEPEADAVVFSFGTNDVLARGSLALDHVAARIEQLLAELRPALPVAVVGMPPIADAALNGLNGQLNERQREVAAAAAVRFFDVYSRLLSGHAWLAEAAAGDGAHPGATGYYEFAEAVMAEGWLDWLRAWR